MVRDMTAMAGSDAATMLRLISCGLLIALQIGLPDEALGATGASLQQRDVQIDDTPLLTIGDDADEALHGVVAAVLTDDVLILAEKSTHSLRFYNRSTGTLIRAVGQKGEGPGDFGSLNLLQAVGDRLYTFDSRLMRVTVWTLAGEVERTVRIRPWGDYSTLNVEGVLPRWLDARLRLGVRLG